ncbi:transglutaminase domain-containing protein [Litchfieldia alkalitelluris]|uniref:transglutaminase domain-containing protein n=1 Tax=Litchfieldia alkalitelluris TaxID=304268 RepID=UPI0009968AC1|nr:transglutaminase domain-containing protein [Litchfieldia alkalitelluris]
MTSKVTKDLPGLILSVFGFLLLWEWLRPLTVVTDTAEIYIFIIFIGICFLLSFLKIKRVISSVIKMVIILYMLNQTYFEQSFLTFEWVRLIFYDLRQNLNLLIDMNWNGMSALFRSFLFFILLWLMSYLIYYWLIVQKKILLFFILTVVYVSILDAFSPYDANAAIIRTVVVGFLMLGLLNLNRVIGSEKLSRFNGLFTKWIIPLVIMVLITSSFGYFAPKAAPQWPDPVPYLKGYGKGGTAPGSGVGMKKIGYGTNDSYLGGPFIEDNTPVFKTTVGKRHYWRVETKDLYTGKGWEVSSNPRNQLFESENNVLSWIENKAETEEYYAEVDVQKLYPHIIYPSGLKRVDNYGLDDSRYSVDPVTEKILTKQGDNDEVELAAYGLTYDQPIYQIQDLQAVTDKGSLELNDEFFERYTQLPDSLPERVKELAVEITKDQGNRYDKVVAVERYFKDNLFMYDTKEVAVPGRNDDYVDQFLFETKVGYCDNFSTSMIVLLRSLDIPARWVKGYTEGTYIETLNENQRVFEVTNNNAHSWVEVYFPEFGWIAFEPTKGFSNLNNFVYTTSSTVTNENNDDVEQQTPTQELLEESTPELSQGDITPIEGSEQPSVSPVAWKDIFFILLSIVLVIYVVIKTRVKWYPILAILLYKRRNDGTAYFKAFDALLKQLDRVGIKRNEGQTLREFAVYVDKFYRSDDMQKLTLSYERALYRKDNAEKEWKRSVELWENLIKKVSS